MSDRSLDAYHVCDRLYQVADGGATLLSEADRERNAISSKVHRERYFISYSRKDAVTAAQVVHFLEGHEVPTWFDQNDITHGKRWDAEIEFALTGCRGVVVLLSPNSVVSENVLDEISYALDHGRMVMPILIAECKLPLRLTRVQYRDVRGDFHTAMREVVESLKRGWL
jgi:hypothetical protein